MIYSFFLVLYRNKFRLIINYIIMKYNILQHYTYVMNLIKEFLYVL